MGIPYTGTLQSNKTNTTDARPVSHAAHPVKEASRRRLQILRFHLHDVLRKVQL